MAEIYKYNCTEPVQGLVIKERKRIVHHGKRQTGLYKSIVYDATVVYTVNGKQYKGRVSRMGKQLGVGNTVELFYDPNRIGKWNALVLPSQVQGVSWLWDTVAGRLFISCVCGVIGLVFISVAWISDKKRVRRIAAEEKNT